MVMAQTAGIPKHRERFDWVQL